MSGDPAQRIHSPSGIALANRCRHAWALRYVDRIRAPELEWEAIELYDLWRKHGEPGGVPPAGAVEPRGGQRGAALGTRVHLYAERYLTGADAEHIDWTTLPGQVLQAMLPHLPDAGSVSKADVERQVELEQDGVSFRGVIDMVVSGLGEVWDHKTTRDVRAYALLPDAVARAIGQPERSLKNDLQACTYALWYARRSKPSAAEVTCRWTYTETQKIRRALPVVQVIPVLHARKVVAAAADVARTLTYTTSAEAPANTLACDEYGGCWYRQNAPDGSLQTHCSKPRDYGAILRRLETQEREKSMAPKPLTFAALRNATEAAAPAAASSKKVALAAAPEKKFAPKKAEPAPPEPEETEEETVEPMGELTVVDHVDALIALGYTVALSRTVSE